MSTYPTPPAIDSMPAHMQDRPASHALWAAARAQERALAEVNSARPNWGVASTWSEGCRQVLDALRLLSAVDPDPGQLGAIAAGMGFGWDIDEEAFTAPLLAGIR